MNPLISVIVPVYSVEPYIRQCIDSIVNQTYDNLEIILVDDESPDNCPAICDEYSLAHENVHVIHKPNGGLSDARNVGIAAARGEYLGFVDSDDWIAPDMYEYLYNGLQQTNADIAVCELYNVWKNKSQATYRSSTRLFSGRGCLRALLQLKVGNYAWNKLYRRSLWADDIHYPKGLKYEDVRTTYRVFERASIVVALPEAKYYYRRHNESITGTKSILNQGQCVESRMTRFNAIGADWPDLHAFLYKEIYEYTLQFKKTVSSANKTEFSENLELITTISSFLAQHEDSLCNQYGWGKAGRASYHSMTIPTYSSWKRSIQIDNLIQLKEKFRNNTFVKKIRNRKELHTKSTLLNRYFIEDATLPLDDNSAFVESRGGEDLAGNMFRIASELCMRGMTVYLSVKPQYVEKVTNILQTSSFNGLQIVEKGSPTYYTAFARSKYCFNDMVYHDLLVKRDGQIWVNTWHGTPLKMLEYDVVDQRHVMGGGTRGYLQCDYLAVSSHYLAEKLLLSSHTDQLFRGEIVYSGYPRNEIFFDTNNRRSLRQKLSINDKEVFVYMPTWRGTQTNHQSTAGQYSTQQILDFFESNLDSNQVLYVKLHNYAADSVSFDGYVSVRPFPSEVDTYAFLNCSDCLITDYSSVFFDYANTRRKVILFAYDREEYLKDRGLYFNLDELPFPIVSTYDELSRELNLTVGYNDSAFLERFCTFDSSDSTTRLLNHVLDSVLSCKTGYIETNGKKNILLYDAEYYLRSAISDKIESFLSELDPMQANYYYGIRQWALKSCPQFLKNLPEGIRLYSLAYQPEKSLAEERAIRHSSTHLPASLISRETRREFYGIPFDKIIILNENSYDPFVPIIKSVQALLESRNGA